MIGGEELLLLGHHQRLALGAHHHLVLGVLELDLGDHALVAPSRHQRRLVDEVQTFASPAMARPKQRLAGAGRTDQEQAARDAAAEPLEFTGIAEELDGLLQVELGLVDAGHVLEGDAAVRLGQKLGRDLPKPSALPPAPCIWREREIHTPISATSGNHEIRSDTNHGSSFLWVRAVIKTPLPYRRWIKIRPSVKVSRRLGSELIMHPAAIEPRWAIGRKAFLLKCFAALHFVKVRAP